MNWPVVLMALIIGAIGGAIGGYTLAYNMWREAADEWRSMWEDSMESLRSMLSYQVAMVSTVDRAASIAESFSAEDAYNFIVAELEDWPLPEEELL